MKFLNKFNSISDAKTGNDIYSPQVTIVKENGERQVMYSKDDFEDYTKLQVYGNVIGELSFIEFVPSNMIKYKGTAKVTPNQASSLPTIVSNDFDENTGKGVIRFETDVIIIGSQAFKGCSGLTSVTIPNSVTTIEEEAFKGCSGLTSMTIPDGVTSITRDAFHGCGSLASVTISNSVGIIGWGAFENCTSLISISYTGTMSDWSKVGLGIFWNDNIPATVVHCTDGDVNLN